MPRTVTYRGVQYTLPSRGDPNWDVQLNAFLSAVTTPETVELSDPLISPVPVAGKVVIRSNDTSMEVSEDGRDFQHVLEGALSVDIRDCGTNVMNGDHTADTVALDKAVSLCSANSDSSNPKNAIIRFPIGELLLDHTLTIYGQVGAACSWVGRNGRSKGPEGTVIKWNGPDKDVMVHSLGLNGSLFDNICFNAAGNSSRARFCWWGESNQRNSGSVSSDNVWSNCTFANFGHYGAGFIAGDEPRSTLHLSGISGTFIPGELVLGSPIDGIATVVSLVGSDMYVKESMGGSFTSPGTTVLGLTSGATATVSSVTIDTNYQGNRQFSEGIWDHCLFTGTEATSGTQAGWAGWTTFGANNNKNYELKSCRFDGTRYAVDWASASGFLNLYAPTGGNIGHSQVGFVGRFGSGDVNIFGGDIENEGSGFRAAMFQIGANCTANLFNGQYFGLLPSDDFSIVSSGVLNMYGVRLTSDSGIGKIKQTGGSLAMYGVEWRPDFDGYLPIEDSSGNKLGLFPGDGDYSRGISSNIVALGCLSNVASSPKRLPDLYMKPLSPAWNQLLDNSVANSTVVRRGVLSRSVEVRTVSFTQAKNESGNVLVASARAQSKILGIVADVTEVFKDGGGTITGMTLKVGNGSDDDLYLLGADCFTATGQFGLAPAERGVGITVPNVIDATTYYFETGGFFAPWAATDDIKIKFTPTGAAISALTQGSVTLYITYEVM